MDEKRDEYSLLSDEDAKFIERLAENYSPPPLTAVRSAALDTALRERVATPRGIGFAWPAFASAVVGLAIGLALTQGAFESTRPEGARPGVVAMDPQAVAAWEQDLFDPESFEEVDADGDLAGLPDDYAAIAGIFLDG
jgi:hypothetical protein